MTGCFYLDTLGQLGSRELTPVYCRVDDILYAGISPELAWSRATILATGGERCDFHSSAVAERIRSRSSSWPAAPG